MSTMTPEQALTTVNDAANDARHRGDYKRANDLVCARVALYQAAHLSQPAQTVDKCHHQCKRMHPHCKLSLTRDGAPDDGWHWSVTMPDGHLYDLSHGRMTFEQALADMHKRGVTALDAADAIWRNTHSSSPAPDKDKP